MERPLKHITREDLAPIWGRLDIPTERVAERLGVTRQGLSYKAKSLGLPSRAKNRKKLADDDTFRRMWMAGVSAREMTEYFGFNQHQAVTTRRRLMGLPARTRVKGTTKTGGWQETISLEKFAEMELARLMGGGGTDLEYAVDRN